MLRRVTVTDQIVLVDLRLAAAIGAVQTDPDRLVILLHFDLSGSELGVHRLILLRTLTRSGMVSKAKLSLSLSSGSAFHATKSIKVS